MFLHMALEIYGAETGGVEMSDESQAREVVRYIWENGIASSSFEDPRTPSSLSE